MSQMYTCPVTILRHTMSALPSPLKSPTPSMFQPAVGVTTPGSRWGPSWTTRAIHEPDVHLPVRVAPKDVGLAVAIEVAADCGE